MLRQIGFVLLLTVRPAWSWGALGHRTVAYLAEKQFTSATASMVASILSNDKGWDISDAAVWADEVRWKRPYTEPWHFIDAQDDPPSSCGVDFARDCDESSKRPGCVVSAIANMTSTLMQQSGDATAQQEALMYLIHFVGDVHQPLHNEKLDRGGNSIAACFDQLCKHVNLHSIWDTYIPSKMRGVNPHHSDAAAERQAAADWATELYGQLSPPTTAWMDECQDLDKATDCALGWAGEANQLVCSVALQPGVEWIESNDLGSGAYYDDASAAVQSMILAAGRRLAAWLNALSAFRGSTVGSNGSGEL